MVIEWKDLIEFIFSFGLFINAILFIPQAIKILQTKTTQGISLTTFIGFNIIQIFTFLHGYLHKDYLLMIGILLSFMTCSVVTVLIIVYMQNSIRIFRKK